jgi:hypothetical protein
VTEQVADGRQLDAVHPESRRKGVPQILPPKITDAGSLERRTEHAKIKLGAIGRTGARVIGEYPRAREPRRKAPQKL